MLSHLCQSFVLLVQSSGAFFSMTEIPFLLLSRKLNVNRIMLQLRMRNGATVGALERAVFGPRCDKIFPRESSFRLRGKMQITSHANLWRVSWRLDDTSGLETSQNDQTTPMILKTVVCAHWKDQRRMQ